LPARPVLWGLTSVRPPEIEAYTGESDWNSLRAAVCP